MTTTIHLVRHAAHGLLGRVLAGRMDGVPLDAGGRADAEALGRHFLGQDIAAVQSSPMTRAKETAEPIAAAVGAPLEIVEALDEIDCGDWTGLSFAALGDDPRWKAWNEARGFARIPGGETMRDVQARMMDHICALRDAWSERTIVLVSHADTIKAALLYVLGLPFDALQRIDVDPASITTLVAGAWGAKVTRVNARPSSAS